MPCAPASMLSEFRDRNEASKEHYWKGNHCLFFDDWGHAFLEVCNFRKSVSIFFTTSCTLVQVIGERTGSFLMRLNYSCLLADTSCEDEFRRWRDRRNENEPHRSQWYQRDREGRGEICGCFNKHTGCPSKWRTRPLSDSFTEPATNHSRTVTQNSGRLIRECFVLPQWFDSAFPLNVFLSAPIPKTLPILYQLQRH